MKKLICVIAALLLFAGCAFAEAPANPLKTHAPGMATPAPTLAPTPAPARGDPAAGTSAADTSAADASADDASYDAIVPESDTYDDGEAINLPTEGATSLALIDGVRHILLVGLDARPGEKTGRSDTMILLTLDGNNKAIKMTSLMRDLYVTLPGMGNNRINAAWVFGGPDLLLQTIEFNFGIKIEDYVAVDFTMLADVIDQLGGITVDIKTKQQMNAINGVIQEDNKVLKLPVKKGLLTTTGEQLLTGRQAQAYARYRKGESDFTRTERQREVIIKCIDKLGALSTPALMKMVSDNIGKVTTNLTLMDVMNIFPVALSLRGVDVQELRIPADGTYTGKMIHGMSVLVPDLAKNKALIEAFING